MSTFDARLEQGLRRAGLLLGPLLALGVYLLHPGGHGPEARILLAILALAVTFWMTEAIPLPATALLASALCIVLGVAPAKAVLAPYADPVIFLFTGTFLLSEALQKHGLDRLLAGTMLRSRRFGRTPRGLMAGFGLASAAISTALSNTATAAMMTPIARGAVEGQRDSGRAKAAPAWVSGVLLMVAYGASIGGMATLVGTPPNLLVAGFVDRLAGVRVGFVDWLRFGVPIALVLLLLSWLFTARVLGRPGEGPEAEAGAPPPAQGALGSAGARWTLAAFLAAGLLWVLPAAAALAWGAEAPVAAALARRLPEAGVAILLGALLFALPASWRKREFVLAWPDAQKVNWGILLLFGGGLSLGTLAEASGLAAWVGSGIAGLGLARTPEGFLAVCILAGILVSEFASNTAAATLLVPVVIAAAKAAGFDPVRPALGVGLAATCGFIFPVSTPPNAIVFGTGLVPLRRMIQVGLLLDLASAVVIWAGLLLLTPWLPR
jgi:sodium-dependent dicarboxylate transporter 2/3/5